MKINAVSSKLIILFLSLICTVSANADQAKQPIVVADIGLATPESVEYYAKEDVYLVTNINGSPFAADGNGFISKIKPDGSVIDLKWIDGTKSGVTLNAPKGAAIHKNKLYVADINQVHVFELPSGKQLKSITVKGSTFLNGITPGSGNYLYVTDSGFNEGFSPSGTDAIYKVKTNGKYKTVVKNKDMGHPNGVWQDNKHILMVTFGTGKFYRYTMSGKATALPTPPQGSLDGLIKLKDGRVLISSWAGSALYTFNKDKTFSVLADSLDAPADIGLDTKRNRVLVPLFKQNKIVILPLKN